jgi:glutaconyl-CoA/methylmalonyl-CoA decarboxylase subunit gamma
MKFNFNNQGKDFEVEILDQESGIKITVNGKEFAYDERAAVEIAAVPQTMLPRRDLNSKEVRAVLAGTITDLNVSPGDIVKVGQKLLTLSAMKMENEILAEVEGRVKEVNVAKDQKVKEGDVLITLV